jgi:pimeloyl-ACP methyl ester carboxylesterase
VTLAVALNDPWVPPRSADRLAGAFPRARIVEIGDCGHLAHEEKPGLVETVIVESAQREGILPRVETGPSAIGHRPSGETA